MQRYLIVKILLPACPGARENEREEKREGDSFNVVWFLYKAKSTIYIDGHVMTYMTVHRVLLLCQ